MFYTDHSEDVDRLIRRHADECPISDGTQQRRFRGRSSDSKVSYRLTTRTVAGGSVGTDDNGNLWAHEVYGSATGRAVEVFYSDNVHPFLSFDAAAQPSPYNPHQTQPILRNYGTSAEQLTYSIDLKPEHLAQGTKAGVLRRLAEFLREWGINSTEPSAGADRQVLLHLSWAVRDSGAQAVDTQTLDFKGSLKFTAGRSTYARDIPTEWLTGVHRCAEYASRFILVQPHEVSGYSLDTTAIPKKPRKTRRSWKNVGDYLVQNVDNVVWSWEQADEYVFTRGVNIKNNYTRDLIKDAVNGRFDHSTLPWPSIIAFALRETHAHLAYDEWLEEQKPLSEVLTPADRKMLVEYLIDFARKADARK